MRVVGVPRVRGCVADDLDAEDHQALGLGPAPRATCLGAANERPPP
jgi:hypothetical protein